MKLVARAILSLSIIWCGSFARALPSPSIEVIHALTGASGTPVGNPVIGLDGTIYGVTQYDGIFDGSIFSLTPDGSGGFTYQQIHAFRAYDGYQPQAGLIVGSDGLLYGTTSAGGQPQGAGNGTIFRFDPASRTLTTLHVFTGADGAWPQAALVEAPDGSFYGTTRFGGDAGMGTVFRLDSSSNFTRLHSFDGTDGKQPMGRLYRAANGDLYGTAARGASDSSYGAIFRIDNQGIFSVVHVFSGGPGDGSVPRSGLVLASNGLLYGTTGSGGMSEQGTLYSLDSLNTVTIVHSYTGGDGATPIGDLAADPDGSFVGTTSGGGDYGLGTVFRFSLPSSVVSLHSFAGPDGQNPAAGVVVDPGSHIFGVTWTGGAGSAGVVFEMDSSGAESVLHAFLQEGAVPIAPLLQATSGKIYGVASWFGSIFEWDPSTRSLSSPVIFPNVDYGRAYGGLMEAPDGWFYGTAAGDQSAPSGIVYRARLDGTVETLHHFGANNDGSWPLAGLVLAQDGNFYGSTSGGVYGGNFFRVDSQGVYTSINFFDPSISGGGPCGKFLEASPGVFAGSLQSGGPSQAGTVSTIDVTGNQSLVYGFSDFRAPDGTGPCSDLTRGADGAYYGTTVSGLDSSGRLLNGTAYRVSTGGELSLLAQFHGNDGNVPLAGLTETSPGVFYGTTVAGGLPNAGTIFRTNLAGRFESLYSFDGGVVGLNPYGTLLLASDGFLYGTTSAGGWWAGTLFRLSVATPGVTVEPTSGPADSPTPFLVTGSNFHTDAAVTIGSAAAGNVVVAGSGTTVNATSPLLEPGTLNQVQILNEDMTSSTVIDGWLADFLDVPQGDVFHSYVETVVRNRIAAGVGGGFFGRDEPLLRGQMAVLLLKTEHGSGYVPPACTGVFSDVPCEGPFTDWIEQLFAEGITGGCGVNLFCPSNAVTRAQMAVFLLKTEHGAGYAPPPCTGVFEDVQCPSLFANWIEKLYADGVTGGCSTAPLLYCPDVPNTRGQAAVFLVKAFNLQ